MKFSKNNMRLRGLASLVLIAIIGALFVIKFNDKNSEVARLAYLSNASAKLNATINSISATANRLRFETSQTAQKSYLHSLEALKGSLKADIYEFDNAVVALSSTISEKAKLSAGFSSDHLWPEERVLARLEEMSMVEAIVSRNNKEGAVLADDAWNYVDTVGITQTINSLKPFAKPAQMIGAPIRVIIPTGRHNQTLKINDLQLQESAGLKWITISFIATGLAMLGFIGLFIYWPLDRTINTQISQLNASRKEVEKADRSKSEFLANMSHEIRTPMNGVMGMAELLAKTELDAKQRTFTDIIVKSGASLLTIINDILDFSKIDAGQMELESSRFKLAEAIEDVATLVSSRVAEKDLELIVRVDPSLPDYLIGDVGRIRQIVTNLMGNAVKFTEKGHVFVDVSGAELVGKKNEDGHQQYSLKFKIEDTGVGIPEDKCAKVFEKFSQVDASATRKHEGTGLGLAISSSLVELMGGHIGVESEVNVGSTFWFTLELPSLKAESKGNKMDVDVSGSRVLIVDDNEVNRSILTEQMGAWRFDSAAAVDGKEALAVMRAAMDQGVSIDAVVLDYHMPGMNGGAVVGAMRADPKLVDIPVIMLTSVEFTEEGKTFSSLGVQGHLTKPARSSLLLETIVQVISDDRAKNSNDVDSFLAGIKHARNIGTADAAKVDSKPAVVTKTPFASSISETTKTPKTEVAKTMPQHAGSGIQILVCEDNEVNQIVFTQTLQEAGFEFKIASNGKKGVEYYKIYKPSLVLMDVSMPEINGLDATKAIREMEADTGIHTPIIGVTAHAIKGDMERCLEAGMDDYLSKPISPDMLTAKISKYLNKIGATKSNVA